MRDANRPAAPSKRGHRGETEARRAAERRGVTAEFWAALWLRLKGYRILGRRVRTPVGEIDLLVRRGGSLIAVEVKARRTVDDALAAVSGRQRQRIVRALDLLAARDDALATLTRRLDVVAIRPWRLPHHLRDLHRDNR